MTEPGQIAVAIAKLDILLAEFPRLYDNISRNRHDAATAQQRTLTEVDQLCAKVDEVSRMVEPLAVFAKEFERTKSRVSGGWDVAKFLVPLLWSAVGALAALLYGAYIN